MELNNKRTDEKGSLFSYMKELSNIELLTSEQEQQLFEEMRAWTLNENCSAEVKAKGQSAREKLIVCNLRLVIKIAKEFRNTGLDYEDLINEGNLGLITAIDKFDPSKGAKLSYYSSFWIKQFIRRSISNKGRTIRLPVGVIEVKLKIQKYIDRYQSEHQKMPTNQEISKGINVSLDRVNKIVKLSLQCESLNVTISDEDESELMSVMENKQAEDPKESCQENDDKLILNKFLNGLSRRERYIIIRRFGLDGHKPDTLEAIGQKFDLTRERIRQLELSALRGLKDMYKSIDKNSYIE